MTTTTTRPTASTPAVARAPGLNRNERRVRITARSMMSVQIAVVTWACLHAWFYSDDYMIRSQGATYSWFDPTFLFEPWGGHWMPAAFAVAQPFAKFGDFTHGAIAVSLAAGQALVAVLLYRFLRRHFGFRWRILIPLALYLTSIPVLQASVWWAAGLQALPLLACIVIVSDHTLRLAHGRRVSSYVWIIATTTASLAFFEKSILIPVVVLFLLLATTPVAGPVRAALRVVRLHWPLALGLVLVDGAWLVAYRIFHTHDISASPSLMRYGDQLSGGLVGTFVPSLYGGPWDWRSVATSYNAVPTMPAVALALSALTAVIVLFVMTWGPRARRLVAMVVTYALLLLALINAGRSAFLIETASLPRYYADLAMVTVIASAVGLARLKDDPAPEMLVEWRPRLTRPRALVLAAFVQVLLISWFVSSTALASGVGRGPERPWVSAALASLRADTSTSPVLDRTVPAEVLWPVVFPQNLYHWFFSGVSGMPTFSDVTDDLRLLDDAGALVVGHIDGVEALPGPTANCGWAVTSSGTTIPLRAEVINYNHTISIAYIASMRTKLEISTPDGDSRTVDVARGLHDVYAEILGGGRSVTLRATTPGATVCVGDVRVGVPALGPRPLG
jgi:hypothetical protein